MKKITFLLAFVAVAMFANAADWVETFGPDDAVKNASGYWPYVSGSSTDYVYINYDHAADCTYEGWKASVRKVNASTTTAAIGNSVWIGVPGTDGKGAYFTISGIDAAGAQYISFDVATASGTSASFVSGDLTNLTLTVNDVAITLPSKNFTTANVMESVSDLPVATAAAFSVKFSNTSAANGYRIDNVKFSATTPIKNVTIDNSVYATNGTVYAEGEFQIFSVSGQNVTELNGQLNGIYVVKTAKGIQKVAVK